MTVIVFVVILWWHAMTARMTAVISWSQNKGNCAVAKQCFPHAQKKTDFVLEKNWDDDHLHSSFFLHHLPWEFLHLFVAKHSTNFFCFGDTRYISTAQNFLVSGRLEVTWRQLIWTCWFGFPHEDWMFLFLKVFWSSRSKICLRQILQRKFFALVLLLVVKSAEGPVLLLFSRIQVTPENNDVNSTCHFKLTSVTNVVIKEWQEKTMTVSLLEVKNLYHLWRKNKRFRHLVCHPWARCGVLQNVSLTYLRDF